ncbi:MAG: DUF87 domain-containing protein [Thaumarchaeota archaeon]|nr:DUF87 domain-containing protein [Nitrososphaerota archaeon]
MENPDPAIVETPSPVLRLGRDAEGTFEVDANVIATGRTCIIGASGSGKSYAVGVVCEELCKSGVPFAIIDTEGEHSGLKEKYDAVCIGDEPSCDLQWSGLDLDQLGAQAPDLAPLILDLSESEEPKQKVSDLLTSIYREVEKRRTPYLIIVEEADRFVPQNGERVAIFGEIARRGRKRGVGLMVCTQRPSMVDKNILSQCGNQLIGKLVIRNDLQAVTQFFQGREIPKQLTALPAGNFYAMGGLSAVPKLVTIRQKETRSGGSTPRLGVRVIKPFKPTRTASPRPVAKVAPAPVASMAGINPVLSEEDVRGIVRRDKAFVFFGSEETVTDVRLVLRTMVEIGVAAETGILRKRIGIRYLVLDGVTGRFVELRGAPVTYDGFQPLIGLSAEQIGILRETSQDNEMVAVELADKLGISKEMLRRRMKIMEERRLVRSSQVGRSRLYRRTYSFPELRWQESEQALGQVSAAGEVEQNRLSQEKLRQVITGMIPHSEVQGYRAFVYPLYRVELVLKGKKRVTWVDGRTGVEVRI